MAQVFNVVHESSGDGNLAVIGILDNFVYIADEKPPYRKFPGSLRIVKKNVYEATPPTLAFEVTDFDCNIFCHKCKWMAHYVLAPDIRSIFAICCATSSQPEKMHELGLSRRGFHIFQFNLDTSEYRWFQIAQSFDLYANLCDCRQAVMEYMGANRLCLYEKYSNGIPDRSIGISMIDLNETATATETIITFQKIFDSRQQNSENPMIPLDSSYKKWLTIDSEGTLMILDAEIRILEPSSTSNETFHDFFAKSLPDRKRSLYKDKDRIYYLSNGNCVKEIRENALFELEIDESMGTYRASLLGIVPDLNVGMATKVHITDKILFSAHVGMVSMTYFRVPCLQECSYIAVQKLFSRKKKLKCRKCHVTRWRAYLGGISEEKLKEIYGLSQEKRLMTRIE